MIGYINHDGVYIEAETLPAQYTVETPQKTEIFTPVAIPPRPDENHYWDGDEWRAHAVPVPESVTKLQAYKALVYAGYKNEFDSFFAQNPEAKTIWDLASVVERHNPLVGDIADALGLDDTQVDELFIAAAGV